MSRRDWRESVADMIEYLAHAEDFMRGVDLPSFAANTEKFLAVSRALEIAGEAAKQVPDDVRARYPQVEWRSIAGFRDVLAHGYLTVSLDIIWDAAVNKAPAVRRELLRILEAGGNAG